MPAPLLRLLPLLLGFALTGPAAPEPARGAAATGQDRNLFAELLHQSSAETDARIDAAWRQLFYGNPDTERVYFVTGPDEACIIDLASRDVRSEGMSYGMMIAVQLGHREEFDRLWQWARVHMYHADGPRRGCFAWHCRPDGKPLDPGSAADGEEWFAMALFFASHRWGDGQGIFNYGAEAQALLRAMRAGDRGPGLTAFFDPVRHQVVFCPTDAASKLTDPSYHLPAFYELWARWDRDPDGRAFWAACAAESRAFFRRCAHPRTGLMPEYAHFDGKPYREWNFGAGRGDFRYDAWRTLANVALDQAWFDADPWAREQSNRVLRFLSAQPTPMADQFSLDGHPLSDTSSAGLQAMAAVAGLAAAPDLARPFAARLWNDPVPSGPWRYYNGLLHLLGLMEAGGRFRIIAAPAR